MTTGTLTSTKWAAWAIVFTIAQSGPTPLRTYQDPAYGFSIDYPDNFVVLPSMPLPKATPQPVHRVRFQDRAIAGSDPALRDIPLFSIDVFDRAGMPLRQWLETANRLPPDARANRFQVAGAREGLHVRLLREISPSEYYYVATDTHVIVLTPAGPAATRMVESFRLKLR